MRGKRDATRLTFFFTNGETDFINSNRASFRAAKHALHAESGSPIQLSGKPLHVVIRQKYGKEAEAWCAESGFVVRHVGLEVRRSSPLDHCLGHIRDCVGGGRRARSNTDRIP